MSDNTNKIIVAFGNPLLDITINITDDSLLRKHNLKVDGVKEVAQNKMKQLLKDISTYEKSLTAGGCAQNTCRVLQWLLQKTCSAFIFGSVGFDSPAITLKNLIEKDGVQTRYLIQDGNPTGTTVALINGSNRSLVAYIGAAEMLSISHLMKLDDFEALLKSSDLVYVEGFFLTQREKTAEYILDYCKKHDKVIAFNISGEYMCENYPDIVKHFVENADVVFGNRREYEALCAIMNATNVRTLTENLVKTGKSKWKRYGNIVVVTNGPKTITCVSKHGTENIVVPPISVEDIIDTTGAGDAFVAGFLAGLIRHKTLTECSQIGCYASLNIIKQTGCTLPNFKPDFQLLC